MTASETNGEVPAEGGGDGTEGLTEGARGDVWARGVTGVRAEDEEKIDDSFRFKVNGSPVMLDGV